MITKNLFLLLFGFFLANCAVLYGTEISIDDVKIVEQALTFVAQALKTDTITTKEAIEFKDQACEKLYTCEYAKALEITLAGLEKFPKSFLLQTFLAMFLGDFAEACSGVLQAKMAEAAKRFFEKLMNELQGQSNRDIYRLKNEYCYRFGLYKEQYENGRDKVADCWGTSRWLSERGYSGYYCQGVGAANYAKNLILQGDKEQAYDEAQKSLVAWAQYFSYENDYYNSYVHYALALGILGYKEEMMRALQRGADLIKRDVEYFEFKDIIDFVASLEN